MKGKLPNTSLVLIVVLLLLPGPVFGDVTATYIPEPSITLEISPGPFTHNTVLGAKLGTFIITSSTGVIYTPSLVNIGEASGAIPVTGLMKEWEGGQFFTKTEPFHIISVAYPNGLGGTPVLNVLYNKVIPIMTWQPNTVTQNPFYVELYFLNTNSTNHAAPSTFRKAQLFKLDSPYSLPPNFNPRFSVGVADSPLVDVGWYTSGGVVNESLGSYVVTNGNAGPDNTPIIAPNGYTNPDNPGSPGFYYGDVETPDPPSFAFNIVDSTTSFSLNAAYGTNKATVTQATVQVLNGVSGQTYHLSLTFTDTSSATSFQLFPQQGDTMPINYDLFLGTEKVTKGSLLTWTGLQPGVINTKDIKIGGINKSVTDTLVSDLYEGTITVTISNLT